MKTIEKLFKEMVKAIEIDNEKELQYLIAKRDKEAAIKAYREAEICRNLTGAPVGEGASKRIYCGTEDYVEFFETIISTLGLDVKYEIEDCDGEKEIVIREVRL